MASAAEQLIANLTRSTWLRSPELRSRVWFTIGALIVYRLGTYLPVPGVNAAFVADVLRAHRGDFLGLYDAFTGGALRRVSILALNVTPWLLAQSILQLKAQIMPAPSYVTPLAAATRNARIARHLAVAIALVQSYWVAVALEGMRGPLGEIAVSPGWSFRIPCMVSLTGGAIFLMWLVEQINERGIKIGAALILTSGLFANVPESIVALFDWGRTRALSPLMMLVVAAALIAIVAAIVFMEAAERRIPVSYPKRGVGKRSFGGESYLPFRVNSNGMIPVVLAGSVLLIPITIANSFPGDFLWRVFITSHLARGQPLYLGLYAGLIFMFAHLNQTAVLDMTGKADDLNKFGAFVPGIRPGGATASYLNRTLSNLTAVGTLYLVIICVPLEFLVADRGLPANFAAPSIVGMTLTIMTAVREILSYTLAAHYESLLPKPRVR